MLATTAPSASITRVLEPEVMDTAEEADDYDAMDHGDVNRAFCADALQALPTGTKERVRVLDLGTGTALIPIQLCTMHEAAEVLATDFAKHMLSVAEANVARASFRDRITLSFGDAKSSDVPDASFDLVICNSVIHHIPEPLSLLRTALSKTAIGGVVFIRDLERPQTEADLEGLVERYAAIDESATAPERLRAARQRTLFAASLRAALTLDEIRSLGAELGIPEVASTRTSDRHWTLAWTRV